MLQNSFMEIIIDQTNRALWEIDNVIYCVPDELWDEDYCEMPLWKHIYHTLHSLDQWLINPFDYNHPLFHTDNLNNLDAKCIGRVTRNQMKGYYEEIANRIRAYLSSLSDDLLLSYPPNCPYTRFTLILAQHRHLHTHMGMLMGYIIAYNGQWPRVLGLTHDIPQKDTYNPFF